MMLPFRKLQKLALSLNTHSFVYYKHKIGVNVRRWMPKKLCKFYSKMWNKL